MLELLTISLTVSISAISNGIPISFSLRVGSGDITVLELKFTLFPARLCLILPSLPLILSVIVLRG